MDALDALDRAHHAYTLAALKGSASVDHARSVLIETRAQLHEEFGAPARRSA